MTSPTRFLAVLILAAIPALTAAQTPQDTVELGGVALSIGMTQADVQGKLAARFDLPKDPTAATWDLAEKGRPGIARATVQFKDGRLIEISKYWTVGQPDTQAGLADALYAAISAFQAEGRTACTVQASTVQTRTGGIQSVYITCGHKSLETDILRDQQGRENATLTETLTATR